MNLTRRRTTASHSTTKRQSVWRGSISNYGISSLDGNDAPTMARPISWHPNSVTPMYPNEWTAQSQHPDSAYSTHVVTRPFATTEVHGLVTPLTQPSSAESCYNEAFTPLEEMHSLDNTYSFSKQPGCNSFYQPQSNFIQQFPTPQSLAHQNVYAMNQQAPFMYASAPDVYTGTAPPTPELLPNSNSSAVDGDPSKGLESEDEVLVGMGLYDAPSPPNTAVLNGSRIDLAHGRYAGKGLKLEETFEPSTEDGSEEEDEDDSNDEAAEDDAAIQQLASESASGPAQAHETPTHPAPTSLANQSFFFENDNDDDQNFLLQQTYNRHFNGPIWTDVYSTPPINWV